MVGSRHTRSASSTTVGKPRTADGFAASSRSSWQPIELDGMHDVYYGTALPPNRKPIQIFGPFDRIGVPYLQCPAEKIIAIVPTHSPDRNTRFAPPDANSRISS